MKEKESETPSDTKMIHKLHLIYKYMGNLTNQSQTLMTNLKQYLSS